MDEAHYPGFVLMLNAKRAGQQSLISPAHGTFAGQCRPMLSEDVGVRKLELSGTIRHLGVSHPNAGDPWRHGVEPGDIGLK